MQRLEGAERASIDSMLQFPKNSDLVHPEDVTMIRLKKISGRDLICSCFSNSDCFFQAGSFAKICLIICICNRNRYAKTVVYVRCISDAWVLIILDKYYPLDKNCF